MSSLNYREIIDYFLKFGAISTGTIVKIADDLNLDRKMVQTTIQIGLDEKFWVLDENLHLDRF